MKGFLLDTSSNHIFCGISSGERLLHKETIPKGRDHSKELFHCIENTLEKLKLSIDDLDYIGVGIGPGSYIGTRAAASVCKALAFGRNIPLIPFCSLLPWVPATWVPIASASFLVSMPSKKGDYCVFRVGAKETELLTSVPKNRLEEMLSEKISHISTEGSVPSNYHLIAKYCFKKLLDQDFEKNYNTPIAYLSSP